MINNRNLRTIIIPFSCKPRKGTTDAIYTLRTLQRIFIAKQMKPFIRFMDVNNIFDGVLLGIN